VTIHCASAPGKLMLAGEYVVLDGAVALVCAVDRRALACLRPTRNGSHPIAPGSPERGTLPPEALLTRSLAESRVGMILPDLHLDVTALRAGDRKLGLGSSAAGAAATAGLCFAHAGHDLSDPTVRQDVLDIALEGHRSVAPEGSGADVAASVLGGFVRFQKGPDHSVDARSVRWPEGLHARIVWTGTEARTSDLVRRVRELEATDAPTYLARMGALRDAAEAFVAAFEGDDAAGVVEATRAHHRAMAELGAASGAPIVEDSLSHIATVAEQHGGAAKPSGAGGGDIALVFCQNEQSADAIDRAFQIGQYSIVDLRLGAEGVTATH
jgi:phosphomevalonate kinase